MRVVARSEFPEADTSDDVEFTDWGSVEAFADAFAAFLDERTDGAGDAG